MLPLIFNYFTESHLWSRRLDKALSERLSFDSHPALRVTAGRILLLAITVTN